MKSKLLPSLKPKLVNVSLFAEIRSLIESARKRVAVSINAELSLLYWNVGRLINNDILKSKRAEYGKQVIADLAERLTKEYGNGWSKQQLKQCVWFAKIFPDEQIGYTVCNQLTWSHIRIIIPIEDSLKRDFYIEMCKIENWSVRTLRERIDSMLYERTAISKKPELTIKNELSLLSKENKLTPDMVFKDPYFLDFLGLKDMEVYLRYLEKYESIEGENTPIGLILCSGKKQKQELVELLELDKSGIRVAEYLTELPSKKLLEEKLIKAIQLAKNKLELKPKA
jgi:hypothetical protein